jgi:hypothetical protein
MSFVLIRDAAEAGHGRERREKQRQGPGNEVRLVCILMADRWGALSQIKSLVGIGVCERRRAKGPLEMCVDTLRRFCYSTSFIK